MPNAVVDKLEQATLDVHARAEEAFARDLAAYRAGVQAMAKSGGTLPEAQADELVGVCQRLGIASTRLAADAVVFIKKRNIEIRIDAVQARNEARIKPLPQLHHVMEAATAEFLRVQTECRTRVQAAEAALNKARRAYDAVANQREERFDNERNEITELQNRNPHLFQPMTGDELRRYLGRT